MGEKSGHPPRISAGPQSSRGVGALLWSQALGAFNDNAWKMIVVALLTRGLIDLGDGDELEAQQRTMWAFCAFSIPLLMFSLPAGAFADRVSKHRVLFYAKLLEVCLMAGASAVLYFAPSSSAMLLSVLGLMGLQSAIFGPAKYGILPELVPHERLSIANGKLELSTFIAIIAGTALGPWLLASSGEHGLLAGGVLVILAAAGAFAASRVPAVAAASKASLTESVSGAIESLRADRSLWLALLGATWFWTIGSLLGQDMVVFGRSVLGLDEALIGLPLGMFGLGVGVGAMLAGKLSEGKVETGLIPLGAIFLSGFTLALGLFADSLGATMALMTGVGVAAGFVIVPIDALIQWRSPADRRGSIIAMSNVLAFGGMMIGSLAGYALALSGVSSRGILIGAGLATLAGTMWALYLLPEACLRVVIFLFTHTLYRVRVFGRSNVPAEGGALLTPNHVSFVDGLFLLATIDRPIRFIVDQDQFNRPLARPILKLLKAIPISSSGGMRGILHALKAAGQYLDDGELVCIFPEGQITRTGALQPFRRGMERIAKGRSAPVIPVHLDRVWGSVFSFSGGRFLWKLPERVPYRITVSYGTPLSPDASMADVRREVLRLSDRAWHMRAVERGALHLDFVRSARRRPFRLCMVDARGEPLSRLSALAGALALGRALSARMKEERRIGILLPPGIPGALVNIYASFSGRPAVNLNYTAGAAAMASATSQAEITRVITSRAFVQHLSLVFPAGVEPIFLEDVQSEIDSGSRFAAALLGLIAPRRALCDYVGGRLADAEDPASVLFSSGSTGEPKGVVLSHFNVDSNVCGVAQVFRVVPEDRLLGVLPLFHSFGNMSLWFALQQGVGIVFHPDPLDAVAVGRLVQRYGVTLMLATPTFLSIYARRCSPDQLGSLRIVLAGAEKLSDRVADMFEERFGIRPLEGYGTTECAPVIATGIPPFRSAGFYQAGSRRGTVGPPLPGIAAEVVDPDTLEPLPPDTAGMLRVRGPNVMVGYLGREDLTREVLHDGWYTTGDIAMMDGDGFIRITDRLSRFSKIGGEMVPHGRVEQALHEAAGEVLRQVFLVTSVPDERKGERLAVLTTLDLERVPAIIAGLQQAGLPNLFIPRPEAFLSVPQIPMLGTGKVDLKGARQIAQDRLGS